MTIPLAKIVQASLPPILILTPSLYETPNMSPIQKRTNLSGMTEEEKRAHRLALARARNAKYRNAHREELNAKRRKTPAQSDAIAAPEHYYDDAPTYVADNESVAPQIEPTPAAQPQQPTNTPFKKYTFEQAQQLLANRTTKKGGTTKVYLTALDRIKVAAGKGCKDLVECIKNYKMLIGKITDKKRVIPTKNKKQTSQFYGKSTIIQDLQTILILIDDAPLDIPKDVKNKYALERELIMKDSSEDNAVRNATEKLMPYPEVVKKVVEKYGPTSKMGLVFRLYEIIPARDNFSELHVINNEDEATNDRKNYVVINNTSPVKFVINDFKTSGKYDKITETLPTDFSNEIKKYREDSKNKTKGFLFGKAKLSGAISKVLQEVGAKQPGQSGSVDLIRRMLSSAPTATVRERGELAQKMKHTLQTHENRYRHTANIEPTPPTPKRPPPRRSKRHGVKKTYG